MSLIKGLNHVSLRATSKEEFDKTVDFYTNVLSLPVLRTFSGGIMFDAKNAVIELFSDGKVKRGKGVVEHFAFTTDSADDCAKAVTAAGYTVTRGPVDIDIKSDPVYKVRVAFCNGPLGEEIEFFEERK